jgi:hypothetical protein
MADTNALAPGNTNALRSQMGDLTPQQMLMLYQMGLLPASALGITGGSDNSDNANITMQGYETPNQRKLMGNANVNAPFAGGNLSAGVNAQYGSGGPQGQQFSLSPSMALALGKLQAQVGQRYATGQKTANTYGGSVDLGPVSLNYQRDQSAMPTNTYGVSVPLDDEGSALQARMTRGRGMSTQYGAGLRYGDLELEGEYTPAQKAAAMYARYKAQF